MAPPFTYLEYLLLSGSGLMLFYLADRLLLGSLLAPCYRRGYYLIALVTALVGPWLAALLPFRLSAWWAMLSPFSPRLQVSVESPESMLAEAALEPTTLSLTSVLYYVWCVGMGFMLLRIVLGLLRVTKVIRQAEAYRLPSGEMIYLSDSIVHPFIFLRYIVLPRALLDSPGLDFVLTHERAHRQGLHYLDLWLGQLCTLIQWFNPFAWGITAAHNDTLEYLADEAVLQKGADRKCYQRQLLESTLAMSAASLGLSFSVHNLKKRIVMMNNPKTTHTKRQLVRLSVATAVISAILLIGSNLIAAPLTPPVVPTQTAPEEQAVSVAESITIGDREEVYDSLEVMPQYKGGNQRLMKDISTWIVYPEKARMDGIQGRVSVQFVIGKDGAVSAVKVLKSVHPLLDAEAVRVVQLLDKRFIPGKDNKGEAVACRFVLPINFRLNTLSKEGK